MVSQEKAGKMSGITEWLSEKFAEVQKENSALKAELETEKKAEAKFFDSYWQERARAEKAEAYAAELKSHRVCLAEALGWPKTDKLEAECGHESLFSVKKEAP
jgi:hypothetical protein